MFRSGRFVETIKGRMFTIQSLFGVLRDLGIDPTLEEKWDEYVQSLRVKKFVPCCFSGHILQDNTVILVVWHQGRLLLGKPEQPISALPEGAEIWAYPSEGKLKEEVRRDINMKWVERIQSLLEQSVSIRPRRSSTARRNDATRKEPVLKRKSGKVVAASN